MGEKIAQYVLPAAIAAFVSLVSLILPRIWKKKDDKADKHDELINRLDKLNGKVDGVQKALDKHISDDDERDAVLTRVRIQRFNDEILHGIRHSKEHFDQILLDISHYNCYCGANPNFENQVTLSASDNIKSVYQKCLKENTFL